MTIRPQSLADQSAVRLVNEEAFGRPEEANLVEALHATGQVTLSLVAWVNEHLVGHILFCPVKIEANGPSFEAVGLGPMAVLPAFQKRGIGSALVRTGLERLRSQNHQIVVVLGHPEFYSRFGFTPASSFGIGCQFEVPDEAFMLAELAPGAASGKSGTVVYPSQFNEV